MPVKREMTPISLNFQFNENSSSFMSMRFMDMIVQLACQVIDGKNHVEGARASCKFPMKYQRKDK